MFARNDLQILEKEAEGVKLIEDLVGKKALFILTISNTRVAEIPGITVAGADPELVRYTPAADAELLQYGECRSISGVPATPDGKPTPALITATALRLGRIPHLIVDAGAEVKPQAPYVALGAEGSSENIVLKDAAPLSVVQRVFENAKSLGESIAKISDYLILGESIPGGTTTALAVLCALGVDARGKVSSSMPTNPHHIKTSAVNEAMKRLNLKVGDLADDPLTAVARLGDLMMVAVAGIALGSLRSTPVLLAGGTQMAAVLGLIRNLDGKSLERIGICTTRYVVEDRSADLRWLISETASVPLIATDPGLAHSKKRGLRAYGEGFVKEGVGAGGSVLGAMLQSEFSITKQKMLREIEENYETLVEKKQRITAHENEPYIWQRGEASKRNRKITRVGNNLHRRRKR
jgi:uncharacterized protein (TIGR00303 family)